MAAPDNCRRFAQHPSRDRVLNTKHVADLRQPGQALARLGGMRPALVGIEDYLHAGRGVGDLAAPADNVVGKVALELNAVIAQLG